MLISVAANTAQRHILKRKFKYKSTAKICNRLTPVVCISFGQYLDCSVINLVRSSLVIVVSIQHSRIQKIQFDITEAPFVYKLFHELIQMFNYIVVAKIQTVEVAFLSPQRIITCNNKLSSLIAQKPVRMFGCSFTSRINYKRCNPKSRNIIGGVDFFYKRNKSVWKSV